MKFSQVETLSLVLIFNRGTIVFLKPSNVLHFNLIKGVSLPSNNCHLLYLKHYNKPNHSLHLKYGLLILRLKYCLNLLLVGVLKLINNCAEQYRNTWNDLMNHKLIKMLMNNLNSNGSTQLKKRLEPSILIQMKKNIRNLCLMTIMKKSRWNSDSNNCYSRRNMLKVRSLTIRSYLKRSSPWRTLS